MRGITSGLQPRRYADGDLVQKALDLGVTPFGMSDEEIMEAIVEKRQTDDISGASADFGEATEGFKRQVKENFFDYTDPLEYATLPLVSLRAAKLAGKAGPAVYNAVRGPASQFGGKIMQNIRGIGAYIGVDELARRGIPEIGIPGYENPFGEEAKQARQDAQDEAAEDLKFMTGKLEGEDFVDFELNAEGKKQKGISLIDPDKPMETGTSSKDKADEITSKLSPKDKEEQMMKGIAALFEAYGESQSGGGTSLPGGMIKGTAINTPEITRYQGGGIADMMPQEPMMMADGGIAQFSVGGAVKKAIKVGIEKGIGVFNKAKKSASKETKKIKEERKVKPQSTKKSKSTDLALYDEAAAKAAAPTRTRGYLDFLPAPIAGAGVAAGKGVGQAGRALYDLKKPLAIPGALAATGLGIATYANSGDPEPTAEEIAKAKKDAAKAEADAAYKARQAAREGLTALPEIRAARALERAQESGRTEANFVDYIATFPASYTEKIGKDPEFAKQMMAGFIAMAKPTEGFVPRNAFVDFGEAAMKERERQEGEVPEALQTLQALQENPELKAAWDKNKRGEITPDKYLQTMAGLMNIAKDVVGSAIGRKIKPKENLVDANGLVVTGAELIKRYQEGDISAVQAYAQTLTPEEG